MAFSDKLKNFMDKSVEVTKTAINKAGVAVQDLGDKGVNKIETIKLENEHNKLLNKLGELVYKIYATDKTAQISLDNSDVSDFVKQIAKIEQEMDEKNNQKKD